MIGHPIRIFQNPEEEEYTSETNIISADSRLLQLTWDAGKDRRFGPYSLLYTSYKMLEIAIKASEQQRRSYN